MDSGSRPLPPPRRPTKPPATARTLPFTRLYETRIKGEGVVTPRGRGADKSPDRVPIETNATRRQKKLLKELDAAKPQFAKIPAAQLEGAMQRLSQIPRRLPHPLKPAGHNEFDPSGGPLPSYDSRSDQHLAQFWYRQRQLEAKKKPLPSLAAVPQEQESREEKADDKTPTSPRSDQGDEAVEEKISSPTPKEEAKPRQESPEQSPLEKEEEAAGEESPPKEESKPQPQPDEETTASKTDEQLEPTVNDNAEGEEQAESEQPDSKPVTDEQPAADEKFSPSEEPADEKPTTDEKPPVEEEPKPDVQEGDTHAEQAEQSEQAESEAPAASEQQTGDAAPEEEDDQSAAAATKIQALERGRQARRRSKAMQEELQQQQQKETAEKEDSPAAEDSGPAAPPAENETSSKEEETPNAKQEDSDAGSGNPDTPPPASSPRRATLMPARAEAFGPEVSLRVVSCTSEDEDFPAKELEKSESVGWLSAAGKEFPVEIGIRLNGEVRTDYLRVMSHYHSITQKIEVHLGYATDEERETRTYRPYDSVEFERLGHIKFSNNESGSADSMEMKTVGVGRNIMYIKLVLHECHENPSNPNKQVGLKGISVHGELVSEFPDA